VTLPGCAGITDEPADRRDDSPDVESNHNDQRPRRKFPIPSRITHRVREVDLAAGDGQKSRQRGGEEAWEVLASLVGSE
jgi:hypothetical protein